MRNGPRPCQKKKTAMQLLTLYLAYLLTRGDTQKCWSINNYMWSEHVDRENAQEAEFRVLYADMVNDGLFSD